jgi:hypothetical protein
LRQSVIDLLQGNLEDIREITADDPFERIVGIAQTAIIPESRAPQYFNYGVLGNDLKIIEDTVVFARFTRLRDVLKAMTDASFLLTLVSVITWRGSKTLTVRPPLISC